MRLPAQQAHQQTADLYQTTFGETYAHVGCSYRGPGPDKYMTEEQPTDMDAAATLDFVVGLDFVQARTTHELLSDFENEPGSQKNYRN